MGCGASVGREKTSGLAEPKRDERPFQPHPPPPSTSHSNTSHSNTSHSNTSHAVLTRAFERSHSSNVDWRAVARGSPSPVGRHMPGGGKLIGSSLTGSSLDRSGRSSSMGSSTELSTGTEPARCNGDAAAPSTLSDGATIQPHRDPPPPPRSGRASAALTHSNNTSRCPELSEQKQTAIDPEEDGLHLPPGDHQA